MDRISEYMSPNPYTISFDEPVGNAVVLMAERRIRHLPVMGQGSLVGIVSERDINLIRMLPEGMSLLISDVMIPTVYAVPPHAPLADVVTRMAREKYGAVIIQDESGKVTGIFTAIDALKILSERLK